MTTETKSNKTDQKSVDGRDKVIPNTIGTNSGDQSDTADMNESLKSKPTHYNCTPATVYTTHKSGERMNSYKIVGTNLPKVGDIVQLSWKNHKFNGTVVEFTSEDVIRLRKSK